MGLCRKYFSALSSSCRQNLASVCSAHSLAEAVYLGVGTLLRLKCHLHGGYLLSVIYILPF